VVIYKFYFICVRKLMGLPIIYYLFMQPSLISFYW